MSETFLSHLAAGETQGGFQTDDVLAAVLPLFRQIVQIHAQEMVAPLEGIADVTVAETGALQLSGEAIPPRMQKTKIEALQRPVVSALRVVGHGRVTSDSDDGVSWQDLQIGQPDETPTRPVYLPGYRAWEQQLEHHDVLTDIFCAGQILASLACGLDFTDSDDLAKFVSQRDNLFALNDRLHPVLAAVIVEMTELNRHQRVQDLPSVIRRLETYRDQTVDLDIKQVINNADEGLLGRRRAIQSHLRDRLFDLSRRNRLLYFKPTQAAVNLTVASVPLVIDLRSVRPDHLLVWNRGLANDIREGSAINLARFLRFEDQPYLPGALDKLIADARRDRAEYGFSQLRLILSFLRWHNLKESPEERISSPLLLLPVELEKKKGVRDQYILQPATGEAEVNPVLRHSLKQLYGIQLPETVELSTSCMEELHKELQSQIHASEPGVTLRQVTEPEIELVYQRARQRLDQFRRRNKLSKTSATISRDYSYDRSDWRPQGLQLFRNMVMPQPLPLRDAVGAAPNARVVRMSPAVVETEKLTYTLKEEGNGNPYSWDFDLCALTLCNFNYRKMSLVRDYSALLESDMENVAFDNIFSITPKPLEEEETPVVAARVRWPVVPGDATQSAAVALAQTGRSYIIQGPPGTGKSQTITNLIADFVARGKRVLFVCEKRAAIDVVFHRLRQQGLDELCCLIHDSQTDKKSFIQNLKQTYELWLAEPDNVEKARQQRESLTKTIEQELEALERFDEAMRRCLPQTTVSLRTLLERLTMLREHEPTLTPMQAELLPDYDIWIGHADLAQRIDRTLKEFTEAKALGEHVFRTLGPAIVAAERPLTKLIELVDETEELLDVVSNALSELELDDDASDGLDDIEALFNYAFQVAPLASRGQLSLLDAGSVPATDLNKLAADVATARQRLERAKEQTKFWRQKLPLADLRPALEQARGQENSIIRIIQPSWWRLKGILSSAYDFSQHSVSPAISFVLENLSEEYSAEASLEELCERGRTLFGADDPHAYFETVQSLQTIDKPVLQMLRRQILNRGGGELVIGKLAAAAPDALHMITELDSALLAGRQMGLAQLAELLRDLREEADLLPEFLPLLSELDGAHPEFARALRTMPLPVEQLEAATARNTLEKFYRDERWLPRFDGRVLAGHVARLDVTERELLKQNAVTLRAESRSLFREHVQTSTLSASQLDAEGKQFKKLYLAGRRDVEREFAKSMRYKAIRELASGESGVVVRDLKPIWLMSPLSVSDTLPMQPDLFDVVIFDEASQIPVEEAVPALYRAPQVIVVGDEMQLPPTNFFSSAGNEDIELEVEEGEERVAILMDADSLLSQGARNLPATLLAWHYRSRSESLIGFSNAAFYAGNLYTIPDRQLPNAGRKELHVAETEFDASSVDALLERPISFHYLKQGVYEQRRNISEAAYIAGMVRELLQRDTRHSIGVVAFSEAQQAAIESALEELAQEDAVFAARLDEEYQREEEDQFCGLFVKNLENVQGDERDIILLSICYAPGPDGKMLMNFGPINQRGGEKRLNVIFSRARHHMGVVSSIRHQAITNDYNDGAAALKNFLRYAEAISAGHLEGARAVLENLNPLTRKALNHGNEADTVVSQLADTLRTRGYRVDERVGQSRFRCDLAVRDGDHYVVGILVDTVAHYANQNLLERYVTRPGILSGFGWSVVQVVAKDWYHEPEAVIARIQNVLAGKREETAEPVISEVEIVPEESAAVSVLENDAISEPSVTVEADVVDIQRYEYIGGNSRKFWEIGRQNNILTVRYGRLGGQGTMQEKIFPNITRAEKEREKLIREKLDKGYKAAPVEVPSLNKRM